MKFSKIKYDWKKVELSWTTKEKGAEIAHHLTSSARPAPAFTGAMRRFVPIVLSLLELPDSYDDGLQVTGISLNVEENDGRRGVVITSQKKLEAANAPLVLNTPHLREPVKDEEVDQPGFFPDEMEDAITHAERAASEYLEGKRAQGDLFGKGADGAEERTPVATGR